MGAPVGLAACRRTPAGPGGSDRPGTEQRPPAGPLGPELESRRPSQHELQLGPAGRCNWLSRGGSTPWGAEC